MEGQENYHATRLELLAESADVLEGARAIIHAIEQNPTWNNDPVALGQIALLVDAALGGIARNLDTLAKHDDFCAETCVQRDFDIQHNIKMSRENPF